MPRAPIDARGCASKSVPKCCESTSVRRTMFLWS
jgi:hypothetical protein